MIFIDTTAEVYESVISGELAIDEDGRVWRNCSRRWNRWIGETVAQQCAARRAETDTGRYLTVRSMRDGRRYHTGAHRLVWHHFNGPIASGLTINHKNGDRHDNRPANLELATPAENRIHALRVLKISIPFKLSEDDVREIRRHPMSDAIALASRFGVAVPTVKNIIYGIDRSDVV